MWMHLAVSITLFLNRLNTYIDELYTNRKAQKTAKTNLEKRMTDNKEEKLLSFHRKSTKKIRNFLTSLRIRREDTGYRLKFKKIVAWFFDHNDVFGIPVFALAVYVIILLESIGQISDCQKQDLLQEVLMVKWIRFEAFLFLANTVGIAVFLFTRTILSRFDIKLQISIQDEKSSSLTDALSRNQWNSFIMQWAINNVLVSIFMFFEKD
jgi:hypothetical protein